MLQEQGKSHTVLGVALDTESVLAKTRAAARVCVAVIVISAAYIGTVAVLMAPAFDVVWPT